MSIDPIVKRTRRLASPLAVVALFLVCVAPIASRGYWSELNSAPDEAAHYVTSLMIRGYLATGMDGDPRTFAEQYYVQYPKVAFGVWPPLFHLMLGGWLFFTGPSLSSAVLFESLTTIVVCVLIFWAARESLGLPLALTTGVWFATLPTVQIATSSVMMDMLCALFMLAATLAFARYMASERTRDALWFAVLASAAILTKYNGLTLVLLPPIAVIASRRWRLPLRANFWSMPLAVMCLCAPWYLVEWNMVRYASEPYPTGPAWMTASHANLSAILHEFGIVTIPLIVLGFVTRVVRRSEEHALWCSLFALGVALWVFHSLVYPIAGARYLIAAFAVGALFAAAGLHWVAAHLPWPNFRNPGHRIRLAACGVALLALTTSSPVPRVERGFAEAAGLVLERNPSFQQRTVLVSSDSRGEGAFVAHVATHDDHRRTIVIRGSKLLASDTWMGLNYQARYPTTAATLDVLDRARVEYVALDDASPEPHHRILSDAMTTSPAWRIIRGGSLNTGKVRVFARADPLPPGTPDFELQTRYSLGYNLHAR